MSKSKRTIMHPAWQAAHELLSDPDKWFRTVVVGRHGYTDAQIATAMRCAGYGDDVVVLYDGLRVVGYELPATWIPVNENNSLDAFPRLLELVNLEAGAGVNADFGAVADWVDVGIGPRRQVRAVLNGAG